MDVLPVPWSKPKPKPKPSQSTAARGSKKDNKQGSKNSHRKGARREPWESNEDDDSAAAEQATKRVSKRGREIQPSTKFS